MNTYKNITPIVDAIPASRQAAKRHYGVHPYFTRRPFNVVRQYILNYSREGDVVLDPFGGSGVTAIEAFLANRKGIQNDINPLANFIATGIAGLEKGTLAQYAEALETLQSRCERRLNDVEGADDSCIASQLELIDLPPNVLLPANADGVFLYDLFSPRQMLALAMLRSEILKLSNKPARSAMLLAFSAATSKLNRTFLSANGRAASRGGSSIFSIYRYKIAKEPVTLAAWSTFRDRAANVLEAKAEIDREIETRRQTAGWHGEFAAYSRDVLALPEILGGQADYVFTDPPYGGHIAYLDLSTMWNAWLGTMPSRKTRLSEIIVGGDEAHSEEAYVRRLGESVRACVRLLKRGRWLSLVFQHWNTSYFHAILAAAAEEGADLKAAVSQVGDPIWSMHKKKGSDSVLAGEMILTFYKTGSRVPVETGRKFDLEASLRCLLSESKEPLYGESLFNRIVLCAWQSGAIESLNVSRNEFSAILERSGWQYDATKHFWLKDCPGARLL